MSCLSVSIHSEQRGYKVWGHIVSSERTGKFASAHIVSGEESIGVFGSVEEILALCEQFQQLQQQLMREEETCLSEETCATRS